MLFPVSFMTIVQKELVLAPVESIEGVPEVASKVTVPELDVNLELLSQGDNNQKKHKKYKKKLDKKAIIARVLEIIKNDK